jgi:uncharacterized repeat protein (TIGR03803 family)
MNKNLYAVIFSVSFCLTLNSSISLLAQAGEHGPSTSFISKPENNSIDVSAPVVKITASPVSAATRYTIQLSTSSDFSNALTRTSSIDHQRTLVFPGLKYGTDYYVRAKTNVSGFGEASKFRTRKEVFPKVSAPDNGTEANPLLLRLEVSPVPNANRYIIELNTKRNFSGPSIVISGKDGNQTSFLVKNLRYGTVYYVRCKSDISTTHGPVSKLVTRKKIPYQRFWGLTTTGGVHNSGTVFSFSLDSATFTKHHDYIEASDYPYAYLEGSLTYAADGGFFGSSECERGGTCANGEIFHVSPFGEYTLISQPYIHRGSVTLASNNHLYVVDDWINYFQGGISRIPATPTQFDLSHILFRFNSPRQGLNPHAPLVELADGYLYGMAPFGGATDHGVIYKIKLDGTGFKVVFHFSLSRVGAYPQGGLTKGADGFLYGTTSEGLRYNKGSVFKIRPDGSDFTTLLEFTGINGSNPHSTVVESGGKIYGMTKTGGQHDKGVLFSVNTDGSAYTRLHSFDGVTGSNPIGAPAIAGSYIFGTTPFGGSNDMGVIFKIKTGGDGFEKLYDFSVADGGNPTGSLLLSEDFFPPNSGRAGVAVNKSNSERTYSVGVFPNPFTQDFTADIKSSDTEPVTLTVTNMYGEIVSEATVNNGPVSFGHGLQKGLYILKAIKGSEVTSYRVVKK